MIAIVSALATAVSFLVLAHGAWWTALCLVAAKRPRPAPRLSTAPALAVIVPAHNEERLLGSCLNSLSGARYPVRPEIIVVADNCTDQTAAVALEHGATVLQRDDPARRGKGYALEFAMAELGRRPSHPDVVVFVDADSLVSVNLFEEIGAAFTRGALAAQVYYAAARGTSGLGRLRRLAFMLLHWSRPLGCRRLGLGTTLKGNGMAIAWPVASAGLGSKGIAEDAAMTLDLARRGIPVTFLPGARLNGHMAQNYHAARTQDERWERGRFELAPGAVLIALRLALRGNLRCAAPALEVASLPLSLLSLLALAALGSAAAGIGAGRVAILAAGSLASYLVTGLIAARPGFRDVLAIIHAPRFVAHKSSVYLAVLARRTSAEWKRTDRGNA